MLKKQPFCADRSAGTHKINMIAMSIALSSEKYEKSVSHKLNIPSEFLSFLKHSKNVDISSFKAIICVLNYRVISCFFEIIMNK